MRRGSNFENDIKILDVSIVLLSHNACKSCEEVTAESDQADLWHPVDSGFQRSLGRRTASPPCVRALVRCGSHRMRSSTKLRLLACQLLFLLFSVIVSTSELPQRKKYCKCAFIAHGFFNKS